MKFNRDRHSGIRNVCVEERNKKLFTFIHNAGCACNFLRTKVLSVRS